MKRYFITTPSWVIGFFPQYCWNIPTDEKVIFLTFDDGPSPEVTPYVLDLLDQFNARATFFCVGKNAETHPKILKEVLDRGHSVGNHTQNHLNGWKTKNAPYLRDVKLADRICKSRLFRPPYGKLKPAQGRLLRDRVVIMWSHMSGDFDQLLDTGHARKKLLAAKSGSIMVFHDSVNAYANLKQLLPDVLTAFSNKGYSFKTLDGYAIN